MIEKNCKNKFTKFTNSKNESNKLENWAKN